MERDPEVQTGRKPLARPIGAIDELRKAKGEIPGFPDPREDEVEAIPPRVPRDGWRLGFIRELADRSEEVLDEAGNLAFGELAELHRVGE